MLFLLPQASSFDMDPTSAAGIGLAVLSLTAQVFTGAMQGTELLSLHHVS